MGYTNPSTLKVPTARAISSPPSQHGHHTTAPVSRASKIVSPPKQTKALKSRGSPALANLAPAIWEDHWIDELDHHGPITGRNVVVFEPPEPPEEQHGGGIQQSEAPLKGIIMANARKMSPREMHELSLDLYASGVLTWDEYEDLAFQAELHPDFSRTIGALTGEKAFPDRPRDFVREWEQKLEFERRFAPAKSNAKERALRILSVLRRIEPPKIAFT
ncbi:MAG: hypothetical protein OQK24_07425 [Magnetovibrio sp.]|nr:hypothetical protein [Magnetovibrio sp.]